MIPLRHRNHTTALATSQTSVLLESPSEWRLSATIIIVESERIFSTISALFFSSPPPFSCVQHNAPEASISNIWLVCHRFREFSKVSLVWSLILFAFTSCLALTMHDRHHAGYLLSIHGQQKILLSRSDRVFWWFPFWNEIFSYSYDKLRKFEWRSFAVAATLVYFSMSCNKPDLLSFFISLRLIECQANFKEHLCYSFFKECVEVDGHFYPALSWCADFPTE